jgi:PAS domain S-box-containing protein
MQFWFNKKSEPQKAEGAQVSQASTVSQPAPATPQPASLTNLPEEKPFLKPLLKTGSGPTVKAVPAVASLPVPSPTPDVGGLKLRPKVDQRALYQQLINGLYDAVLILDERGNIMEGNMRVDEVLGYTRDEAWDLPITTIMPGMTRQLFEHLKKNLAENHHVLIDSRCFRKDGSSFAGEVGVCNITFMRGNNMIFTIRNVERRKSSMADVKKLQVAIENSLSPMFICNTDETFISANQLALDLFGIQNIMDVKTVKLTNLLPNAASLFAEAAKGNKSTETLSLNRQGISVAFKLALAPIKNGDDIIGVTGSMLLVS